MPATNSFALSKAPHQSSTSDSANSNQTPALLSKDQEVSSQKVTAIAPANDPRSALEHKLAEAALTIKEGGVIVCPTEGVYGLSASVHSLKAIERVIVIKQRSLNKGLIIVAADIAQLTGIVNFAALSQDSMSLIHQHWPGHATFIMPACHDLPELLTGGRTTIAVRVSAFPLLTELCYQVGSPIISTSANISGSAPLTTIAELRATFASEVDYILDEPCQGLNKPSTIFDAATGAILRP